MANVKMVSLEAGGHAIYQLAPDLLLVFKPPQHREAEHAHPYAQRLRVLRGALRVQTPSGTVLLDPGTAALTLGAGERHATEAVEETWLVAESVPASVRTDGPTE